MTWQQFSAISALGIVALVYTGCANVPKRLDTTPGIREARREYLQRHPDGHWTAMVARGEVARGMGFGEVFASWGMPVARIQRENRKKQRVEYWAYTERDDASGDWTVYTFAFEKKTLVSWDVAHHVSKNVALTPDNLFSTRPPTLVDPRLPVRR